MLVNRGLKKKIRNWIIFIIIFFFLSGVRDLPWESEENLLQMWMMTVFII